eukprot:1706167-Rhodomonas_salina.3
MPISYYPNAYATARYAMPSTPQAQECIGLRTSYAMPGTDLVYAATRRGSEGCVWTASSSAKGRISRMMRRSRAVLR